jgi:hypothetical protein
VIAVNTSQDRLGLGQRRLAATGRLLEEEAGGLSGRPLRQRALEALRRASGAEVSQEAEVNQVAEVQLQILQVVEQLLLTVLLQAQEPIWPMLQDIQDMMDYSIH